MIAAAPNTHVRVDKAGVAWIDNTNVKVIEVIVDHLAYGHSPDEIHLQHPHLSLAQVHAAFTYYFDHQTRLDAEIERRAPTVCTSPGANRLSKQKTPGVCPGLFIFKAFGLQPPTEANSSLLIALKILKASAWRAGSARKLSLPK